MIVDEEQYLEHYGKKGMRWGTRSASPRSVARQRNKALNKASKAKERKENVRKIEKARASFDSGKADRELRKARQAHSANKTKLGSREARKILREAKQKHYNESTVAMTAKNGKEVTQNLLVAGGVGLLTYAAIRALGG